MSWNNHQHKKSIDKGKVIVSHGLKSTYNKILVNNKIPHRLMSQPDLENKKFPRKLFKWRKDHPKIDKQIKINHEEATKQTF